MIKKNLILSTLYQMANPDKPFFIKRILAGASHLVAWDFPPRNYKKAFQTIKKILAKHGVEVKESEADWPHVSIAYIPAPSEEQKEKIKLAGPLYSSRIRTEQLILLGGSENSSFVYIAWFLKTDENKVKKFIDFISELTDTPPKFKFKPHISIAVGDIKDQKVIEDLLPELDNAIKPYYTSYVPEQTQFWDKMKIYDIDSMQFN